MRKVETESYTSILSGEAQISIDDWSDWEPRLRRQTSRLVRKHRDKIIRLAAALREHKTLEAEAVDKIVSGDN